MILNRKDFLFHYRSSVKEANARRCKPTQYAESQGAETLNEGYCYWWLRSKSHYDNYAIYVYIDGSIYHYGYFVDVTNSVRPVIRLKYNSEKKEYSLKK